jgi:hypothetical protein
MLLQQVTGGTLNQSSSRTESSAACTECKTSGNTSMESLREFSEAMRNMTDDALDIEIISDKMNYSDKCDNFAADGAMNKWGKTINKEISRPKYSSLLSRGPKDIRQYCPMFSAMDIQERKSLNILVLLAMAHYESSCNFREKAPGPNGTAAGLLQLHKGKEQIYSSGCKKNDSANPERSLICGLSMLNDQINRGEKLFSPHSYWEVLRPKGRSNKAKKIMTAIQKFPSCLMRVDTNLVRAKRQLKERLALK